MNAATFVEVGFATDQISKFFDHILRYTPPKFVVGGTANTSLSGSSSHFRFWLKFLYDTRLGSCSISVGSLDIAVAPLRHPRCMGPRYHWLLGDPLLVRRDL